MFQYYNSSALLFGITSVKYTTCNNLTRRKNRRKVILTTNVLYHAAISRFSNSRTDDLVIFTVLKFQSISTYFIYYFFFTIFLFYENCVGAKFSNFVNFLPSNWQERPSTVTMLYKNIISKPPSIFYEIVSSLRR